MPNTAWRVLTLEKDEGSMTSMTSGLHTRRRGLVVGAGAIAGLAGADRFGMPFISGGLAAEPIKIGVSMFMGGGLTGSAVATMAAGVKFVRGGAKVALTRNGGKAMGQPVELVFADEPDPAVADAGMRKFITEHKVADLARPDIEP